MSESSRAGFAALDPCVHCGFCLPACPTYLATGDEGDSPRGRILLMRALERGEIAADDPGLVDHLGSCLGCRGCEPACPSGVGYGAGLETARERIAAVAGIPFATRMALAVFARRWAWRLACLGGRILRATGLARLLRGGGRAGFLAGMVDATAPAFSAGAGKAGATRHPAGRGTVALFRGCVMDGMFGHVHAATIRTLEANGYTVVEVPGQACCGALHAHAGDRDGAVALARRNVSVLMGRADHIVVNSAGCGALLKELGHLVGTPEAARIAASVRDVTELLAEAGPRPGAALDLAVCYDAPCHLQHAQQVHREPLAVLAAVPGLRVIQAGGADRCCGSAGLYGALNPGMSRAVLAAKIGSIAAITPPPAFVATGNPGCLMQIGAGLSAAGLPTRALHPIELLDESYRAAGFYG